MIHPLTILSTLPSAGIGALLMLMVFHQDLSVIALIGIILLIGIVKKNAIMLIDFALEAERHRGMTPEQAIYQACILRFRPILMTTMAALLGGVPLMLGTGTGSEIRQPLGYSIVGGLILSQLLTLYTTPVVYLTSIGSAHSCAADAPMRRQRAVANTTLSDQPKRSSDDQSSPQAAVLRRPVSGNRARRGPDRACRRSRLPCSGISTSGRRSALPARLSALPWPPTTTSPQMSGGAEPTDG